MFRNSFYILDIYRDSKPSICSVRIAAIFLSLSITDSTIPRDVAAKIGMLALWFDNKF